MNFLGLLEWKVHKIFSFEHLSYRDRMILLKMEQEIIDFIGDNKYVKSQTRLISTLCLTLVFGYNYPFWKDLGIDKTLSNIFADLLNGDAVRVGGCMLMGMVA